MDCVILVDEGDREIGVAEKLDAHRPPGLLHRAFSVFLTDSNGHYLLQQRAWSKYHFGGLWSNSCCGHPRPGESTVDAAVRRTFEELGVRCRLRAVGAFVYTASDSTSGLVERELDHVLVGTVGGAVVGDPDEVAAIKYVGESELLADIESNPQRYTPWLADAVAVASGVGGELDRT